MKTLMHYTESRDALAGCYNKDTAGLDANLVLRVIDNWINTAIQGDRNTVYYRGLLIQCGELLGIDAFTADDGTVMDDVLCVKVPELVSKLVSKSDKLYKLNTCPVCNKPVKVQTNLKEHTISCCITMTRPAQVKMVPVPSETECEELVKLWNSITVAHTVVPSLTGMIDKPLLQTQEMWIKPGAGWGRLTD